MHETIYNGHLGRQKTIDKITNRFYRPFLRTTIKKIIRECEVCQKVKNTVSNKNAKLIYLKPAKANELITTDFAGPFKETVRGNKYFQIIIDHCTKIAKFCPTQNIQAETAADNIVDKWCCTYGIPDSILSDQGTQFQSKLLDLVYDHLDIKRLKTTPYHPECDGQSEITVKLLKNMIKCYVDEDQETWDLNFEKYAFAYNSSIHSTTKQTPFSMMFGRDPKIPIDILLPNINDMNREPILENKTIKNELGDVEILADYIPDDKNIPEDAKEYINNLKQTIKRSLEIALKNRDVKMEKAKWYHDRNIKKFNYKIGDLVLANHPKLKKGLSQGIAHKYYGPFEIVGINPNGVDYFIKLVGSKRAKIKQIHKTRLKIFYYNKPELKTIKIESSDNEEIKKLNKTMLKGKNKKTKLKKILSDSSEDEWSDSDKETLGKIKRNLIKNKRILTVNSSDGSENETLQIIKNKLNSNKQKNIQ